MKKKLILLIICLMCVNLSAFSAQVRKKDGYLVGEGKRVITYYLVNSNGARVSFKEYDSLLTVNSNLFIAKNDDKVGLIDGNERNILPFAYQEIRPMKYGILKVKKGNKCGLVNYSGGVILPMKYSYLEKLDDRVLKYSSSKTSNGGGAIGLMDYRGRVLTEERYENVDKFSNYLLRVSVGAGYVAPNSTSSGGSSTNLEALPTASAPASSSSLKYGLIDYNGKTVLSPQYDYIGKINSTLLKLKKGNSWGRAEYYNANIINIMFNYESYW